MHPDLLEGPFSRLPIPDAAAVAIHIILLHQQMHMSGQLAQKLY